ncbi:unnamed protein product [Orchesella dallaii]|uniref:DOMON domain-containing protein n=1 Tax=Orchesella dallaii TaxID=48710 RepID=A0ABP1PHQ5_9HEXA
MAFTAVSVLLNFLGGNVTTSSPLNITTTNFGNLDVGNFGNAGNSGNVGNVVNSVNLQLNENPLRHTRTLDPRGNYRLEWEVDWKEERVIFNVTAATRGYIGFGLSRKGKMSGADIVIGGVDKNGKPYFSDRHAIGNQLPVLDQSQDWTLHEAWERGGLTFLSFSRPFDTCDKVGDLVISENSLVSVIWAYGENDDELEYHYERRGVYDLYLLDPNLAPQSLIDRFNRRSMASIPPRLGVGGSSGAATNLFRIQTQRTVPLQDTLYWCSFHRVPTTTKHHIIGYDVTFPSETDRRHVHHVLLHRCVSQPGSTTAQTLSQSSLNDGGPCYLTDAIGPPGFAFCRELSVVWGVGGTAIFFPPHVGLSMSENGEEYFMLQVHYDNPNLLSNLRISSSIDLYYTSTLRQNDGGILNIGATAPGTTNLVIPPSSIDHVITGHCASRCTQRMFPSQGISVFATLLHTHVTGRAARLRQFRGGKELPWVIADDNFNFNYQQIRLLPEEKRILPGDHLAARCVYDSTLRNGSVVTGGYSTREEMCLAFMFYYTRIPGTYNCLSDIQEASYTENLLGIRNTTFDLNRRETVVTNPTEVSGQTVSNYLTNYLEWDLPLREEVQKQHLFQTQVSNCPTLESGSNSNPSAIGNNFRNSLGLRNQNQNQGGKFRYDPVTMGLSRPSTSFPSNFNNFNTGAGMLNGRVTSSGLTGGNNMGPATWVDNLEATRLSTGLREYQPESKCGFKGGYGSVETEKRGNRGKEQYDDRRYSDYDSRGEDYRKNRLNNQFGYDNSWF